MIALENPPGFVVRTEAQKATFDNGYRIERGTTDGWMRYGSTTAKGDIWLAATSPGGPWFLSLQRPEVAAECGAAPVLSVPGPGIATFVFHNLAELYASLDRVYRLGISLPDAPLERYRAAIRNMPQATEAEYLAVRRVGQTLFRQALLDYWNARCPMTGIADEALLRASHIVAWADCESDDLRLDVHNGLLLSALWDAAFDCGLVSFGDGGEVLLSKKLGKATINCLGLDASIPSLQLTDEHRKNLARHRLQHGF
jgi:hypothetical protein